jgi:hypothetical protein
MAQRKSGYNQTGWRCANTSDNRTWARRLGFDSRLDVDFFWGGEVVISIRPSLGPNQPPIKEDLSYCHKAHTSQKVMLPTAPHVQPSLRIFALQRNDAVFKNTDKFANLNLYLILITHCSGYCSYLKCSYCRHTQLWGLVFVIMGTERFVLAFFINLNSHVLPTEIST